MRGRGHVCRLALVVLLVGVGSLSLEAHQDPCHRRHTCPSDSHAYVCGDRGRCDQCPDNQFCLAGKPRLASTPTPRAHATCPDAQRYHHTPGGHRVLHPWRELHRCYGEGPERRQLIIWNPALAAQYTQNWQAHAQHSQPYVGRGVRR